MTDVLDKKIYFPKTFNEQLFWRQISWKAGNLHCGGIEKRWLIAQFRDCNKD